MRKTIIRVLCLALVLTTCLSLPVFLPEESGIAAVASAATAKLNKTSATIYAGKTVTLKVTGTSKTVTWSSSNKKVATVSSTGKVKGIKAGTATITAKFGTKKLTCTVEVVSPLKVDTTSVSFTTQASKTVTVTFKIAGTIYYSIADSSIVSCAWGEGWNGNKTTLKITPKKTGTTTITISNNKSKDVKKIKVTVKPISGSIQSLLGKKIANYKNRLANKLTLSGKFYMNSYLGAQVKRGKIVFICISSGSKYRLFGVYPGMDVFKADGLLEKAGFSWSSASDSGSWFYRKGSTAILLNYSTYSYNVTDISYGSTN